MKKRINNQKLLFISNHAAFFVSHRLNIFKDSKKNGYKFHLIFGSPASTKMEKEAIQKLKKTKVNFTKFNYSNNSFSLFNDLLSLIKMIYLIKEYKPNIIHSASPKANIYAGFLAKLFTNVSLVMSFSGMGYLYTEKTDSVFFLLKKRIFDNILFFILSKRKKKIIVQNTNDYFLLKKKFNIKKNDIIKIKGGSGIDLKKYSKIKKRKTKNIVMVSRVLRNKGALEYFKAAELLKIKYPEWKFIIIGSLDYNSPDKISNDVIEYYKKNKIIILNGYKKNISSHLANTEIFCLPSHREGMPKATLEALSVGIPVVTTNTVGCRESILPNKNGLLCKSRNYRNLAEKIEKLILNPKLRKKFSKNARLYAETNFSISDVSKKIYKVYENLMYE